MSQNEMPGRGGVTIFRVLGYGVLFLCLVELVIGGVLLNGAQAKRESWEPGTATVVKLEKRRGAWSPVFSLPVGEKSVMIRGSVASNPPAYAVGDKVEMLYPAEAPQDAVTNDFAGLYVIPAVLFFMAATEAVLGTVFLLIAAKRARRLEGRS